MLEIKIFPTALFEFTACLQKTDGGFTKQSMKSNFCLQKLFGCPGHLVFCTTKKGVGSLLIPSPHCPWNMHLYTK